MEKVIAGVIVAVAFGWVIRSIWRAASGKDTGCGSGCNSGCCGGACNTTAKKAEPPEPTRRE
jgi:hypothetical protein